MTFYLIQTTIGRTPKRPVKNVDDVIIIDDVIVIDDIIDDDVHDDDITDDIDVIVIDATRR